MATTTSPRTFARNHPLALATVLSIVSLALVFAAALRVIPPDVIPQAPPTVFRAIPHLNAGLSVIALITISVGVRFARRGEYDRHRRAMALALGLFATFLILYLYKVALTGPASFPGPDSIYEAVYLPLLGVHIVLAVVCVPLLYYVATLGLTRSVTEVKQTHHRTVGRIAATLWVISFLLGFAVYLLLYVVY